MQQAIKMTQELVNEKIEVTPEEKQIYMERLKPEINNLLHQFLPDDITIKEADILAMVINDMVWNPRKYLEAEVNDSMATIDLKPTRL